MRQSSSNSMEGKFTKCSECESKNCTHCEKIVLKVVGTSDSAKELYNTVKPDMAYLRYGSYKRSKY